jgi:hypothetical protein
MILLQIPDASKHLDDLWGIRPATVYGALLGVMAIVIIYLAIDRHFKDRALLEEKDKAAAHKDKAIEGLAENIGQLNKEVREQFSILRQFFFMRHKDE